MRKMLILSAASALVLGAGSASGNCFNKFPAGFHKADETFFRGTLDLNRDGVPDKPFVALGPMTVKRGAPRETGNGKCVIDTEITHMELVGSFKDARGVERQFTLTTNPKKKVKGEIKQRYAGRDFPANSFFDVFVLITIPDTKETAQNLKAARASGEIHSIPPLEAEMLETVKLTGKRTGKPFAELLGLTHNPFFDEPEEDEDDEDDDD